MGELDDEAYRFESHRVDGGAVVRAWVVALLVLLVVLIASGWLFE